MLNLLFNLLPEPFIRLAVMVSLTIAFGGLGFLFIAAFFDNRDSWRPAEYFGMAMAIGPALVILLVSGLSFLGIPLTRSNLSLALLSVCGLSVLRLLRKRSKSRIPPSFPRGHDRIENILPISLFFVLLSLRLIQIRDVFVPNWHEGLIHVSLLQKFAAKSAIPLDSIYPSGFYAIALVVDSFWRLPLPETILLLGQWFSAVSGLSFYIFVRRYIRSAYAAALSFVVYSFALLFPAQLISWGHYPYLLGLALLPPAILTSQDWINGYKKSLLAAFVFVISLGLTHYASLLVWFSYLLVFLIKENLFGKQFHPSAFRERKTVFIRSFLLVLSALMIVFSRTVGNSTVHNDLLSPSYDPGLGFGSQYVFRLFRAHDGFFLLLWVSWLFRSIVRQRKLLHITLLWPLAVWFLTWIRYQMIGSPVLTYIDLIAFLSIPLAFSIGLLAQKLSLLIIKLDSFSAQPLFRHRLKSHLSILLMIAMLVGIFSSPLSIDQTTALFTDEDRLAMRWISDNTPKEAGFLIRTTSGYNTALIPSDGGGWITFLTGRRTIIPEMGELYDMCDFALEHDVNYVYFGKQRGKDRFDLRISDLNADSYTVVYGTPSVEIVSLRCP